MSGEEAQVQGSAPATTSHTLHSSDEAIKVYVRVWPQLGRELTADVATKAVGKEEVEVKSAHGIVKCKFDGVFGPDSTNSEVYEAVGECARSFVKGFNATYNPVSILKTRFHYHYRKGKGLAKV